MRALYLVPRSITRSGYQGMRQNIRDRELSREELGLPQHPANAFVDCPECLGTGEHMRNESANGDPQTEYPVTCGACNGTGELIDGVIDPLVAMAHYRRERFSWAMSKQRLTDRLHKYAHHRGRAMAFSAGLVLTDMRVSNAGSLWALSRAVA